jgi:hypothetical protein
MLSDIERAAAALFPNDVLTPEIRASTVPLEQLEAAHVEGRLWTALTKAGSPVGFAIAAAERMNLGRPDLRGDASVDRFTGGCLCGTQRRTDEAQNC